MQAIANTNVISRDEWLNIRRRGIGGSDAAAVMGMSRYATPYTVWADKTGRLPSQEENERMRVGTYLEPYIADRFTQMTGKRVRRRNAILTNPDYPFALANIDREVVGEKAGVEFKTTNILNLKQFRDGMYPDEYYVQCVHYLAVTGYDRWYLMVLVLGSGDPPIPFTIERDEAEIKALMDAEREFWSNYVMPDIPPPVDGTESTGNAINAVFPGGNEEITYINQTDAIQSYLALDAQIKAMEVEQDKLAQIIKADMGDHEKAECGAYRISWSVRKRSNFDYKAFLKDHPNPHAERYSKTTTYRQFSINSIKEAK